MKARKLCVVMLAAVVFVTSTIVPAAAPDYPVQETASIAETVAEVTIPVPIEAYPEIPLYLQTDEQWASVHYGDVVRKNGEAATIGSHGCGVTCLAMVATYLLDKEYTPADAAEQFGEYNTINGSKWVLFDDSAVELGLILRGKYKREYPNRESVILTALANGQPVIAQQSKGLFTGSGHFIVLVGLTEDGRIIVNDPNGENYDDEALKDGFANGFTTDQVLANCKVCWVYAAKGEEPKAMPVKPFNGQPQLVAE